MSKKHFVVRVVLCAATVVAVSALQVAAQGTAPFKISSYEELCNIHNNQDAGGMSGNYVLTKDIDASASKTGTGHTPIGEYGKNGNIADQRKFNGTLDGNNFTIKGLYINRPNDDYIGLFGFIGQDGVIKNIIIEADSIIGKDHVGVIAGRSVAWGEFSNCIASGAVVGSDSVGGLIGSVTSSSIKGSVFEGTVKGDTAIGGIVGYAVGNGFNNVYFNGTVNGIHDVGGMAGYYEGGFSAAHTEGTINGVTNVGGIAGRAVSTRGGSGRSSHSSANVNGSVSVGGLVGYGSVSDSCYATGNVSGKHNVGGLVGYSFGGVRSSYATGNVNGSDSAVGGLIGRLDGGGVQYSYATGAVNNEANTTAMGVGGLVGISNGGSIYYCYSSGTVKGFSKLGGLVGINERIPDNEYNIGPISDSYSVSDVIGVEGYLGGLVGKNTGTIERSYSVGTVKYTSATFEGYYVSTFVGGNSSGEVLNCLWDTTIVGHSRGIGSGPAPNTGGTVAGSWGMSTSDMKNSLNYTTSGWDFSRDWSTTGEHYPYLRKMPTPIQRRVYTAGANGTITGSLKQTVNSGAAQAVVAIPDEGFFFVSWSDGVVTPERRDISSVGDTITVTAKFGLKYTLKYRAGANGSLVGDTLQTVLESNKGTEVAAVADQGYHFVMWSDSVRTPRRTDLNVSSDIDVYAIFADGVSVKSDYVRGGVLPLFTVRGKTLNVNASPGTSVQVRLVNLRGRTAASFRSVGSASHQLRGIAAGAYIIEARQADGYKMRRTVTIR
jgi:hypothetical protein